MLVDTELGTGEGVRTKRDVGMQRSEIGLKLDTVFFKGGGGLRDLVRARGLGEVY